MKQLKKDVLFILGLALDPSSSNEAYSFSYEQLYLLISYKHVSIRGAVNSLKGNLLVSVYQKQGKSVIKLTNQGKEALKDLFPGYVSLNPTHQTVWSLCTFFGQSESDPFFKKSERVLLNLGFIKLNTKAFLLAKELPGNLSSLLNKIGTYSHLVLVRSKALDQGDPFQIFASTIQLNQSLTLSRQLILSMATIQKAVQRKSFSNKKLVFQYRNCIERMKYFMKQEESIPEKYLPQELRISELKKLFIELSLKVLPHI